MIKTRTIANLTEIYSDKNGGGKSEIYITEAEPTMFPTFSTRRFLQEGQTPSDFREVTAAERQKLEAAAEAWTRPPQLFIDQWNEACTVHSDWQGSRSYGCYNEATGYFELCGITDITYEEAVTIYEAWCGRSTYTGCRAALPIYKLATYSAEFTNATKLEALWGAWYVNAKPIFANAQNAGNIRDFRYFSFNKFESYHFQGWSSLEHVEGLTITAKGTMHLTHSPRLSAVSVRNLVDCNPEGNTMRVHPDVYAKLTGDTTNAAAAALTEEERAEWMALIPLAAEKNITFVSA